ncbi:DNA-binding response regulator [Actinoplanes sp. OR16]|uniref:response regulator transcription factor n=1 Tax=Actinoplanes sp. OR16 TaxID=946334 RepID=UPI000F6F25A7|nr:response regulator transcription factor [Actinoplanes sp. OR16]BBH69316.1 DNA-binding response regulator [Actinoplanes sp. OR16]
MPHVLVTVPDGELRRSLSARLAATGYRVTPATTGAAAMARLREQPVDLIVVDVEIPDLDDLARTRPVLTDRPPIICMTPCESLDALLPEVGTEVEDYVTKPCRIPELLARVRVQLRPPVLRHEDLLLDEAAGQAWRGGRALDLTAAEFRLLRHLMRNARQTLSKEQIAWEVWSEPRDANAIERLVARLRQKAGPDLIHTRRGFGYHLRQLPVR